MPPPAGGNRAGPGWSRASIIQASREAVRTHVVSKNLTPEIYWFTANAIDQGAPTLLTYVANKVSTVFILLNKSQQIVTKSYAKEVVSEENELDETSEVSIRDVARMQVFSKGTQLRGDVENYENGYSRDEYPYASTLECGSDAFWAFVPVKEQNIQGGQLGSLYKKLKDGDQFRVVLDPEI